MRNRAIFKFFVVLICLCFLTPGLPAQGQTSERATTSVPEVVPAEDDSTSTMPDGGTALSEESTETVDGSEMSGPSPVETGETETVSLDVPSAPEAVTTAGAAAVESVVLTVPVDGEVFLQLLRPHLGESDVAAAISRSSVAVTGRAELVLRARRLASDLSAGMPQPVRGHYVRAMLLEAADEGSSGALGREELLSRLRALRITAEDLDLLPLPALVRVAGNLAMPMDADQPVEAKISGGARLHMTLRESPTAPVQMHVVLLERELDASGGAGSGGEKIVFANEFQLQPGRPAVLGLSAPERTTVLVIALDDQK